MSEPVSIEPTPATAPEAAPPPAPLRGLELLKAAVNHILEHPEQYRQEITHCGTTHCLCGWIQVLGGCGTDGDPVEDAARLTGLPIEHVAWLYSPERHLSEIHAYAADTLAGGHYFNRAGFNRDGFDRAGFDRDGFNRDGFNRDGFNRAGFNRAGFDRVGKKLPLLA